MQPGQEESKEEKERDKRQVSGCNYTTVHQRARKVVSDSPRLVVFAIGLVNSVFNLPDWQVMFF